MSFRATSEMPRSPRHVFYDRAQELLSEAGFDAFVEEILRDLVYAIAKITSAVLESAGSFSGEATS